MYLFLKLCVLQAKFCWLGAVEETIFPSKASAAGKKTIQGVWGDLVCRIGATNVICQKPLPPRPLGPHPFSSRPTPPPPPLCPRTRLLDVCWETSQYVRLQVVLRCALLAGNSSTSLAGSQEQINLFPRKLSLKCLKWLQKALFMLCCCF